MASNKIIFKKIGIIESPHDNQKQTPVQPVFAKGIKGKIILDEEYIDGLKDLHEFSHAFIFYLFHKTERTELLLKPFLEDKVHGVFATRAPFRPNKLGMSLVRIEKIENNIIFINDVDVLNGTPLIDIKPYVDRFDKQMNVKSGWQENVSDNEALKRGKRNYE